MDIEHFVIKEGMKRGLREKTIKTYITCLNKFFRTIRIKPNELKKKDIENYLENLKKWKRSDNTINVYVNAIKFFYEKVLRKTLTIRINHKRVRKRLPEFLTKEEVIKLFSVISNSKHKLMIKFLYSTGMRVSELINLKVKDFEFNQNYGWVRDGKGGKDRLFVVSKKLKLEIINLISKVKLFSTSNLFNSSFGKKYSVSSIQNIIKNACFKANITKNISPHSLRHSFATHLIQNGYAVTEVQPLLGHNNINTTMIYLHMASPQIIKVESPIDSLDG
ncbi:MAG: tyrosine-type recombinase/integrase [Candidatus Marinimicrobia bacterium]|nr:tyrosine-type recombinase/integrase [Candidatus Neomarinimicrobiota bacterium]